jgi:hypothetical protein
MQGTTLIPLGGGGGSSDISFALSIVDQPLDGQIINIAIPAGLKVTIPSGMTGSKGKASVAATAQSDFDVRKNNSSVGTIRFGSTETVPSFIMATETELDGDEGDYLTIICPSTQDSTLANIGITIKGTRS